MEAVPDRNGAYPVLSVLSLLGPVNSRQQSLCYVMEVYNFQDSRPEVYPRSKVQGPRCKVPG